MARALPSVELHVHRRAVERAARLTRHALLTCGLAFGRAGGGEQEVLFAVARSYVAAARAQRGDPRLASDIVHVDDGHIVRRLLLKAEDELLAAAKVLARFSAASVRRLVRAAAAYSNAWELDRSYALHLAERRKQPPRSHMARSSSTIQRTTLKESPCRR